MERFCAARVTDPCSATATKYCNCLSVNAMIMIKHVNGDDGKLFSFADVMCS